MPQNITGVTTYLISIIYRMQTTFRIGQNSEVV